MSSVSQAVIVVVQLGGSRSAGLPWAGAPSVMVVMIVVLVGGG